MNLHLVIPAFAEEDKINQTLNDISLLLRNAKISYFITVCDDYSPNELTKFVSFRGNPNVNVVRLPSKQGKGAAIKFALASQPFDFDTYGYIDADNNIECRALLDCYRQVHSGEYDLAAGSKFHRDSKVEYPLTRKFLSYLFRFYVKLILNLKFEDTQTGLKVFSPFVLEKAALKTKTDSFSFDVEFLLRAKRHNASIIFMPITLNKQISSTINLRNSLTSVTDILTIKKNIREVC